MGTRNNIIETNYYYNLNWLSLLKVERQIDSDQLIYVQGFWEQRIEQRREESAAGRVESRTPAETKRVSKERRQSEREIHEQ